VPQAKAKRGGANIVSPTRQRAAALCATASATSNPSGRSHLQQTSRSHSCSPRCRRGSTRPAQLGPAGSFQRSLGGVQPATEGRASLGRAFTGAEVGFWVDSTL
jgi:hypothetical protein